MANFNRRRVLKGILGGSAVTVGLPLLNCFLNSNGTALASGKPLPVRFGTWVWALGVNRAIFNPKKVGLGYELPEEIACMKPVQDKINVFSSYMAYRDEAPNMDHYSGWIVARTGIAPKNRTEKPRDTIDVTIANKIGRTTRFKQLTATASGNVTGSQAYEGGNLIPAEWSPLKFYMRVFGPEFQNPNLPVFTPNPQAMTRKSILSAVMDDIKEINSRAGTEDRQRLDQYLTGVRELEHQLDIQLTKPEPIAACTPPAAPKGQPSLGAEASLMAQRHKMMTDIMLMALICDQTRVFNMFYSAGQSNVTKVGYEKPHHTCTHEEPIDEQLGYQPMNSWFIRRAMESWFYFVDQFSKIKEGDGTLLDNTLIFAHSDQGLAQIHSLDGLGAFTAGRAGGRVKNGFHISGNSGSSITNIGYTAMRVMGLQDASWGTQSNTTSKVISEIMV